ncbi:hypothetical protein Rwratislav_04418 [Rhodococcus wratislaviensis IFP 2016]|nr:hypothetical protein Rwratislav_04418 [Rhodococcus wratislaviensis IFP 2016]
MLDEIGEYLVVDEHAGIEPACAWATSALVCCVIVSVSVDPGAYELLVVEVEFTELGPAGIVVEPDMGHDVAAGKA